MTDNQGNVDTSVNTIDKPVNIKSNRTAYNRQYQRRRRLAKASPTGQLMSRAKAILKANFREYGPRLDSVLTKFEGELKATGGRSR